MVKEKQIERERERERERENEREREREREREFALDYIGVLTSLEFRTMAYLFGPCTIV